MTKTFTIRVSDLVDGRWQDVYKTGTAEVVNKGFQMQLGDNGFCLKVLESAHYATGTIIYAYSHSVRGI